MTDEQLELLTRTAVSGFYSDDPPSLGGPMWENLSTVQRGKWRRAMRAAVRTLEGNRHWLSQHGTTERTGVVPGDQQTGNGLSKEGR